LQHSRRKVASLVLAGTLAFGLIACGGDDDDSATASTTTTEKTTTTAAGEDNGGAPDVNPCAPGESGKLPGETPAAPAADATPITVTAVDYKFEGADALKAGGKFALSFENKGKELHEMIVMHINDDEKRPISELMQEDDPSKFTTMVAQTFACPGAKADAVGADLSATGRYVALCFIPTGTTPETKPADFGKGGAPHAMNGMLLEFTVS
jgi:hypothetical protein